MDFVEDLARADRLLVCTDFDGTICELGPDAYAVSADPRAIDALQKLADMENTSVAVLSGRHLEGLKLVCPLDPPVIFVGSHGAEPSEGGAALTPEQSDYLEGVDAALTALVEGKAPAFVEVKPYARVLHVAALAEKDPQRAQSLLDDAYDRIPGGMRGHNVVEFAAVKTTKGSWLAEAKRRYDATLFAGDDVTDETAFAVLDQTSGDVGVKVGEGPTAATHRVGGVDDVAELFTALAAARRSALD